MKRSQPVYRPMLGKALQSAWYHRELWPFAAIAGFAGAGAVISDVLTQARLSSTLPSMNPLETLASVDFFRSLLENLVVSGPNAVVATTLVIIVIGILFCLAVALCQQIILRASHRAVTNMEPLSSNALLKDAAHPRLGRILLIDALFKILIVNVVVASGVLVAFLQPERLFFDALFGIIFTGLTIAIAFALNILGMFALIGSVRHNLHASAAIEYGWTLLRKHPIACFEMALLLFAANFGISIIAIFGLLMIAVISVPFFGMVFNEGSLSSLMVVTFIAAFAGAIWSVVCAGFSTVFTYLSWFELTEKLHVTSKSMNSRMLAHGKTGLKHFSK